MMQDTKAPTSDQPAELDICLGRVLSEKQRTVPLSTYRVQLNDRFHFVDARRLVPYLQKLGITHLYSSPILMAREGSQHGYDIIDHNKLNPQVGTEEEFRQLVAELRQHGMQLLLDIVPNHMGVGHGNNPWWQDVLQNGRASVHADFFDIDWEPLKPELRHKILIPILGQPYGDALQTGNIRLSLENGGFFVRYFDNLLPVDPQTIPQLFSAAGNNDGSGEATAPGMELSSVLAALSRLPANSSKDPDEVRRRQQEVPELLDRLQQLLSQAPEIRSFVENRVCAVNGCAGDDASFDTLHELLERQAYRLAFWRVSGEEINYRRFFDINDLVGLRMENPRAFAETHRLIRKFLGEGLIAGLRLDHPDGLLNPTEYILRVQRLYAASRCIGAQAIPPAAPDGIELSVHAAFSQHEGEPRLAPLYVLAEKILEPGEHLPEAWPVDGSVGYDFARLVNNLFIDRRNERSFTKLYERVIGGGVNVQQLIYDSKKLVMRRALASEVNVLAHMLNEISNQDRRARDFTLGVLREVIRETIACFPVYRTYIDERAHVTETDRKYINQAIDCAKQQNGTLASAGFDFLRNILLLDGADTGGNGGQKKLYFTLKFQQLTGPVMAKGLEDTACYVYSRFISANDVGGSPADFGIGVWEFHQDNVQRAEQWPSSMLGSSTHDSKRSEDVRARLNVLSEMPSVWATQVMKWRRINKPRKPQLQDGRLVPDANEEYFLYQTLVGAWPLMLAAENQRKEFLDRIRQYMEKAVHEAKVNVSWLNPNPDYVAGINTFLESIMSPVWRGRPNLFWDAIQKFVQPLIYFGFINSLAQLLLKLTSPGVPDIYQGQELWDFSLVDPDNRRPIDFDLRQRALGELLENADSGDLTDLCRDLLRNLGDGGAKLWVTAQVLNFRRKHSDLFHLGRYLPLEAARGREEHVVAFARVHGPQAAITAVPRFAYTLMKGKEEPPLGPVWGDSEICLPQQLFGRRLRNVITGEYLNAGESLLCREIFASFPVGLFTLD